MLKNGWICVWRKIQDWEWWSANANILKVFLYILMNANTVDKVWRGQIIKRGQLVTTLNTLALSCYLNREAIRKVLKHLEDSNDITIEGTHRFSIITISNYDYYQSKSEDVDTPKDTPKDTNVTNNNKQVTIGNYLLYENQNQKTDLDEDDFSIAVNTESEKEKSCAKKEKRTAFQKPTIEEVAAHINENGLNVDPVIFWNYYEANGWKVGKNQMKSWKAALVTWHRKNSTHTQNNTNNGTVRNKNSHSNLTDDELTRIVQAGYALAEYDAKMQQRG